MKFARTTILLVLLLFSVANAQHECTPCNEYRLMFQEHSTTDYAIKENSIEYDLNAVTVCFFARDTDDDKPSDKEQCLYSYSIEGRDNVLDILTTSTLRILVNNEKGIADVPIDYGKWNHVCVTWSSSNGDYNFYKDGVNIASGTGLNKGGTIASGGTTVIGQDQDIFGGGFDAEQSFVGDVTEVNVWGTVLSESDIVAQYNDCQITLGSVNRWSEFKDGVHGKVEESGVVVVEP